MQGYSTVPSRNTMAKAGKPARKGLVARAMTKPSKPKGKAKVAQTREAARYL